MMIIKINIFLCEQLISMFIVGCPKGKNNMAAVSAKRSILQVVYYFMFLQLQFHLLDALKSHITTRYSTKYT